jgi:mono/diheme cytochrome c family protein
MSGPRTICAVFIVMALIVLDTSSRAKADAARGQVLAEQWCSQCHGVRPNEASVNPKSPTFPTIAAEASITETSLRVFLRTAHSTMPNIMLKSDDADDIVEYLLSLKPRR